MKLLALCFVLLPWTVIANDSGRLGKDVPQNTTTFREFELTLVAPPSNPVAISLDEAGLTELIPEAERRATVLQDLLLTSNLSNALDSIRNACGPGWYAQNFVPVCPESWTAEDLHLWRVLTLTPDNAPMECTSIAGLLEIADTLGSFGLVDDASELLSAILGIGQYDTILNTAEIVGALSKDVLATHSAVNTDATLPITLQDWLMSLAELPIRFGPQDSHPGVLANSDTTTDLLSESFGIMYEGTDNRLYYEGLNLCSGKNTFELLNEGSNTTVEFDYDAMNVSGLLPTPAVDLILKLTEHPSFVSAYTSSNTEDAPDLPPGGPGGVWQLPPWLLEYVVTDAGFSSYGSRADYLLYEFFSIDETAFAIGWNDDNHFPTVINQPGWMRAWTLFGINNTVDAQYLWEPVSELVQQRLHEPTSGNCGLLSTAEGSGHARIQLPEVPVGLTLQQFKDGIRPPLETNEDKLIAEIPGPSNLGEADFYLAGSPGNMFLFFIHPNDLAPAIYEYTFPGFFSDPSLQNKISSTESLGSGDTIHEKIALTLQPQTVYVQDEYGDVFQIEIAPAETDRVTLQVSGDCGIIFRNGFELVY